MNTYFTKGYVQVLMSLVLLMVVVALGAYAMLTLEQRQHADGYMQATVTVEGSGEVLAVPDIGQFSFQ